MLTQEQTAIIKATVPVVAEHGNTVTTVFYENLLKDKPSLNEVFNQGNQINGHQAKALAGAVYAYAANVENLDALGPMLERVTQKHASLFIQPDQYQVVGQYLLKAFAEVLGAAFTPQIHDAWAAAYGQLARIMIAAEEKLYSRTGKWTEWRDFVIEKKIPEARAITSFILSPVDKQPLPSYLPGQYISIKTHVPSLGYEQTRQYSLSDKPCSDHYRISVKKDAGWDLVDPTGKQHPGFVSNVLHDSRQVGDIVQLSHPQGDFFLDTTGTSQHPVVLISAGVGITPVLSIFNTIMEKQPSRKATWIHGDRTAKDQAFAEHIRDETASHDNVRTSIFIKHPTDSDRYGVDYHHAGRVDLNKCGPQYELFLNDKSTEYFICGPTSFMVDVRHALREFGVEDSRIKLELFGAGDIDGAS